MDFITALGLAFVFIVFIKFVLQLGKSVPMLELMLLISGLQWIVGPYIEYNSPSLHYKYYMYVPQDVYMGYVVPAYGLFAFIVLLTLRRYQKLTINIDNLKNYKQYGFMVFLIGVFFDVISGFLPGALGFFAFIIANFKFAGAIILFYSESRQLRYVFYGALVYLFVSALQKAMFHDLVLWSVFFYMFWAMKNQPSVKSILITFLVASLSLTTLQTIKAAYRMKVWNGYRGNKIELFTGLIVDAVLLNGANASELDGELNNVRLNQGWIISAIMDEIPKNLQFLDGETIKEAIGAAILPRFLNPSKKKAGGQENFEKFTGLTLNEGTSMGISIIGEAYGNYKVFGGIVFMGIWGFFLAKIWRFLIGRIYKNLMLIAFIPIIFLQVIKAETELVVVLNHLVKSMIVVFLFFWATKRFLNWNFEFESTN